MGNIVFVSGRKRVGKDTFSNFFVEQGYQRVAFADFLKISCQKFLADQFNYYVPLSDFYSDEKDFITYQLPLAEPESYTVRDLLQWYGQMIKEKFGLLYWVDHAIESILSGSDDNIIITDVRFPYEVDRVKLKLLQFNCVTVWVERDTPFNDTHVSETSINPQLYSFQHIINNNGTLEDLKAQFEKLYNEI